MMIYVVAFLVLLLVVTGMAIGVIMGRKPLTGSCGGVGKALGEPNYTCDICGGDEAKCEEQQKLNNKDEKNNKNKELAYEVK